jgi:hypothetical protein
VQLTRFSWNWQWKKVSFAFQNVCGLVIS